MVHALGWKDVVFYVCIFITIFHQLFFVVESTNGILCLSFHCTYSSYYELFIRIYDNPVARNDYNGIHSVKLLTLCVNAQ